MKTSIKYFYIICMLLMLKRKGKYCINTFYFSLTYILTGKQNPNVVQYVVMGKIGISEK